MNNFTFKDFDSIISEYDLIAFDLWGVILEGSRVYEGVVEKINSIMNYKEVGFITNSTNTSAAVAIRLKELGLNITEKNIVMTAGNIARKAIKDKIKDRDKQLGNNNGLIKIYYLGLSSLSYVLDGIDYELTDSLENADIVFLTTHANSIEEANSHNDILAKIAQSKHIVTICPNPDTIIVNNKNLKYCPGYFSNIIENLGGKVIYTGKPKPEIFEEAIRLCKHISKNRILMVGDTFEMDILGSNIVGIDSCLVTSGNSSTIHGQYDTLEKKLSVLQEYAKKSGIFPKYLTSIV